MSELKVLVVDDSKNMRLIVKRYLKLNFDSIEFLEAENGEIAEKIVQDEAMNDRSIDLVILDWMMPKVSGYEFLKKIRSVEKFAKAPRVIMLTAETYSEHLNAAMKYGVSSYITKPFTSEDLKVAVTMIKEELSKQENGGLKDAV